MMLDDWLIYSGIVQFERMTQGWKTTMLKEGSMTLWTMWKTR